MVKAGIYARISLDRDGERLGVARQEKECRQLAKARGWDVVDLYVDNDLSGSDRKVRRPEYERLVADVAAKRIDAVLVWDLDRLTRQPRQLEEFVDVCAAARMRLLATVSGDIDVGSGDGLLVARIRGAVAAEESRKIGQRIASRNRHDAEQGRPRLNGRRPIGFLPDRVTHDPVEAPALREAAAAILEGSTLAAAAKPLAEAGIVTQRPDSAAPTLKRILTSPRIAGLSEYRGEIVGTAEWEPIIERGDWERLRAILCRPGRYTAPVSRHVLTGFAFCTCGSKLSCQLRRHEGGRRIYSCRAVRGGCGHVNVDADQLERHVDGEVEGWLRSPSVRKAVQRRVDGDDSGREAELLAEISAEEQRMTDLAGEVGEMKITAVEWKAMRQPIVDRIDGARGELVKLGRRRPRSRFDVDDVAAMWGSSTLDQKRRALRLMGVEIVVAPVGRAARRFRPERVTVTPSWG